MEMPNIIVSKKSQSIIFNEQSYKIDIYRLEGEAGWTLEVINCEGTSTVWDECFVHDKDALEEARSAIHEGDMSTRDDSNVIPFPKT